MNDKKIRYLALVDDHGLDPIGDQDPNNHAEPWDDGANVAMVETSTYGQTWITLFDNAYDAAEYHINQEFVEVWDIAQLVDLKTGRLYYVDFEPQVTLSDDHAFSWIGAT